MIFLWDIYMQRYIFFHSPHQTPVFLTIFMTLHRQEIRTQTPLSFTAN